MTIFLYVGNTAPSVMDTLKEVKSDGSIGPRDLNGADVYFRMRSAWSDDLWTNTIATVVGSPINGQVRYDWTALDTLNAGAFKAWWHLDYSGSILDYPEFDVEILSHAPRREVGPCTDWASAQDVAACYSDVTSGTCLSWAVTAASEVLHELSGRQFPGYCQSIIRPCANTWCWQGGPLGPQVLDRGHVVWQAGWRYENDDPCACAGFLPKIILPGTAQEVIQVRIGGVILSPTKYRLDPNSELIRTDGGFWPICQNLIAAGDQPGTFEVIYSHGYTPPEVGRRAAAQLAHEFWLACSGAECALPSGVVEIVRQGIKVTRVATLFKEGATGLAMVDSFLAAYGACEPTYVFSPDTFPTSRRTA